MTRFENLRTTLWYNIYAMSKNMLIYAWIFISCSPVLDSVYYGETIMFNSEIAKLTHPNAHWETLQAVIEEVT